ncbi:zinc metallopeptidase [Niabella sp. W65]|nr:zinc metallopeptidase [Niabella sp. W65]MCH7366715.1 zinc metallopeptidase [Niabella sp. W65]ULT42418.1 zinc metallopeptidase [Niabella sp. I65]
MKWRGRRESGNVEDRRGMSGGGMAIGGGVVGLIIYLLYNFLGGSGEPPVMPDVAGGGGTTQQDPQRAAREEDLSKFVKVVLADTEDMWSQLYAKQGQQYPNPTLVLYWDRVESACGFGSAASGPFYCPGDQKLYIDLSFYDEMQTQLGASGDFAMAYVVAHEVGHHIQNLNGTADKLQEMRGRVSEAEFNKYSVKMELQADFLAGVWAHYAQKQNLLEAGDIDEALNAANAIGDDRLQKRSSGTVVPDAFTHGTSAQRMYWFKKGYQTGDISQETLFLIPL